MTCPCKQGKEEAVLVLAGVALFLLGFKSGWGRGRTELLVSLDRAQRIATYLNKEQ